MTKRIPHILTGLAVAACLFSSCTDVDKTLGMDMLPTDQQRQLITDTLYLDAYTVSMDSVNVNSSSINGSSVMMVGSHFDPMFGLTSAGCTFQLLPTRDSVSFGESPSCDSLILQLVVGYRMTGANQAPQTINVYELNNRLYFDSPYYPVTNVDNMVKSPALANVSYSGGDTLRITLGSDLGARLVSIPEKDMELKRDTLSKIAMSKFTELFKGLYITGTSASGNERLNYFQRNALLTLYYKGTYKDKVVDSACTYNLAFNTSGSLLTAFFNTTKHDYSQANAALKMNHLNDTTAAGLDSVLYVEGLYGATPYIKLRTAKITEWLNSKGLNASQVTIARAELIMETQDFSGFDLAQYPTSLGATVLLNPLFTAYSTSIIYYAGYLNSFYYSGAASPTGQQLPAFDGTLNGTLKKYSLNVTADVSSQLTQKKDIGFYLAPYTSNKNSSGNAGNGSLQYYITPTQQLPYKGVIKGPKNSRPIKLLITYAKSK